MDSNTKELRSILKKERRFFLAPNQHNEITIALLECVYCFELVSHVSDMALVPLVSCMFKIICDYILSFNKRRLKTKSDDTTRLRTLVNTGLIVILGYVYIYV